MRTRPTPLGPVELTRLLLGALLALALVAPMLPADAVWGIQWLGFAPLWVQLAGAGVVGVAMWPAANRWIRESGARLLERIPPAARGLLTLAGFAALVTAFWRLRSRTLYGDGASTIDILTSGGPTMNWKEPLDRFITAHVFRALRGHGWTAADAIAAVSVAAGAVYLVAVWGLARSLAATSGARRWVTAFLLTTGAMQLFFGNVENYSLLGAGIALYLWSGNAYLRGRVPFALPCFVLACTSWIHLSAPWLGPTLAVLLVLRVLGEEAADGAWRARLREGWVADGLRQGLAGTVAAAIPTAFAVWLGSRVIGSEGGISMGRFGGGDGKLWVPLFEITSPFEKFTMFSLAHFVAVANEVALLAGPAAIVCLAWATLGRVGGRGRRREVIFLASCVAMTLAYVFFFNPDMAVLNVGILNEWDLFSLPAPPLAALAAVVLTQVETDPERRGQAGLPAVVLAAVLSAAWILHNARVI
ncbi:MAG: hypothetical protein IPK07_12255 [Deltaproteobacteria bacterium]|nr:hypothetical protein [Deltaproteobacteria bacterium]